MAKRIFYAVLVTLAMWFGADPVPNVANSPPGADTLAMAD